MGVFDSHSEDVLDVLGNVTADYRSRDGSADRDGVRLFFRNPTIQIAIVVQPGAPAIETDGPFAIGPAWLADAREDERLIIGSQTWLIKAVNFDGFAMTFLKLVGPI